MTPRGHVEWHGSPEAGRWRTRVTRADGAREWVPLPYELRQTDRAKARRVALHIQLAARGAVKTPKVDIDAGESVEEYTERWIADRRRAGLANVDLDEANLGKYLAPPLGPRSMRSVTRADLERLVEGLDDKVRARELGWKTAANVWGLIRKLFNDAATSKRASLRVLDASPARDVAGTDRGKHRVKQFLWPSELVDLLSCEAVPLDWRRVYACAVYLGARAGELRALRARDVDRRRWVVSIAEAFGTRGSPRKATRRAPKTDAGVRSFAVEPALRPLLDVLCEAAPAGALLRPFRTDGPDGASTHLRTHLEAAGVRRAELFATTETRKRITFHDLRATYCTWAAIRGDEPLKIRARAGHEDLETTMGYVRAAEVLDRELVGEVFPALPDSLVRPLALSPPSSPPAAQASETPAPQGDGWRPQRDSKPRPAPGGAVEPHESGPTASSEGPDAGLNGAPSSPRGTVPGTDPDAALRAAVVAALDGGDHELAAELLAVARGRAARAGVVDLAERRRRAGG